MCIVLFLFFVRLKNILKKKLFCKISYSKRKMKKEESMGRFKVVELISSWEFPLQFSRQSFSYLYCS